MSGPSSTLVDLLSSTVNRYPDRVAVSDDSGSVTYRELADRVRELARHLVSRGIGPGDTVAVLLPRTVDLVVAVHGVLLAGAAYLPLDVDYPAARRDTMMRDGGARAVLTIDGLRPAAGAPDCCRTEPPRDFPTPQPDAAACLLFTSGSTGAPKGIVLEHRHVTWFATTPSIPALVPGDRTAQASSPGFDTFTFEMWRTVAGGAELVVMPSIRDMIGTDLKRELRRRRITAMLAPAAALNHVVRYNRDCFNGLRLLCSGGDVLLPSTCRALRAGGFTGELLNLYGPTETTVACTAYRVEDLPARADVQGVPIGRALEGVDLHVLDADMNPLPDGQMGELYVGGAGVSRGYIGPAGLTDERFLPGPGAPGDRLYRTGDLVVRDAGGVLDYRGRSDDQVKISGVRVEPAEVERALCRHGVTEAAVTASGPPDQRRLVAFLVLDRPLPLRGLRTALAAELLPQLVPHDLVVVGAIVTDHHGKRDWKQLDTIHRDRARDRAEHVAPRDGTERFLSDLWEELLTVERVGATDDFFELGGHSLLAVRARSAIRTRLGVAMAPESIFEHSLLEDLAAAIRSVQGVR